MMLISRVSEGTQTPGGTSVSDSSFHMGQMQQQQGMTLVRPFETMVEVLPQSGSFIQEPLSQPGQQTLFDMIDRNHDGVITRQELAAAAGASAAAQATTQSYLVQEPMMNTQVLPFEPNSAPAEPIMNRPYPGLAQGTMPVQVVPTMEMVTESQVLQPMQAVREQQMDLLTVTPWGYSVNTMAGR